MLAALRSIPVFNAIIRKLLRFINGLSKGSLTGLTRRWGVSGNIPLCFAGTDFKMFAHCDDHIVNALYYQPNYSEYKELNLFISLVQASNSIFDVGANTGVYSILGSKYLAASPNACIYALEPYQPNMKRLKKNLALNNIRNVKLVESAAGERDEIIPFTVPEDGRITDVSSADGEFSRRRYQQKIVWKEITVQQESLDLFSLRNKINCVDLIKIDVEGYDIQVLKGAKQTLKNLRPVIICEVYYSLEKKEFYDQYLGDCGYSIYQIHDNLVLLMEEGMAPLLKGNNYVFAPFRITEKEITFEKFKAHMLSSRADKRITT